MRILFTPPTRHDLTRQLSRFDVGGVYWALEFVRKLENFCGILQINNAENRRPAMSLI